MKYTNNEIIEQQLLDVILSNFVKISQNQYGNYIIQKILEQWWNSNKGLYLKKICIDQFHVLATHCYSSYVCDMFLKLSDIGDKKVLMSNLTGFKNLNLLNCNNNTKIIINKLMNALESKEGYNFNNNKNTSSNNNNINITIIKEEKNDGKNNIKQNKK